MRQSKIRPNKEEGEWTGGTGLGWDPCNSKFSSDFRPLAFLAMTKWAERNTKRICWKFALLHIAPSSSCLSPLVAIARCFRPSHELWVESSLESCFQSSRQYKLSKTVSNKKVRVWDLAGSSHKTLFWRLAKLLKPRSPGCAGHCRLLGILFLCFLT